MSRQIIRALALAGLVAITGCSSGRDRPEPAARPQVPPASQPVRAETPPAPAPQFKPIAADQCGASGLQHLIGKPRTDIPVPLHPDKRRVVCSSCAVTMDYRADRQTIVFDTDSGLIQSVKCG